MEGKDQGRRIQPLRCLQRDSADTNYKTGKDDPVKQTQESSTGEISIWLPMRAREGQERCSLVAPTACLQ